MSKKIEIPNHIAVVMDGNGRWAKQRGLPRTAGHDLSEKLYGPLKSMLECLALLNKNRCDQLQG